MDPKQTVSSLAYLVNFNNPYVKVIIVCKICQKEQSLKFASNWRQHYLTHASNEEKPHKCQQCSKSYIRLDQLKKHVAKTHACANNDTKKVPVLTKEDFASFFSS